MKGMIKGVNIELYQQAKIKILGKQRERQGIGTLSEKTIHAVIKNAYEPDETRQEIPLEGYVADIYRDEQIFEIQTASFDRLRKKLTAFLPLYSTTIVYPIPSTKWIIWIDPATGEYSKPRKSPLKGNAYFIFPELYKIKSYLKEENLHIHIILMEMSEYRLLNGWSKNRKKGSNRYDRIPGEITGELQLERKKDFIQFIPLELQSEEEKKFTSKEFAESAHISVSLAQVSLNILYELDVVNRCGKKGNAYLYKIFR